MSRSRTRTRLSRGLIGILGAVIALGLVVYLQDAKRIGSAGKPETSAASDTKKPAVIDTLLLAPATKPVDATPPTLLSTSVTVSSAPDLSNAKPAAQTINAPATRPSSVTAVSTSPKSPSTQPAAMLASSTIKLSATPLVDAKAKLDAGDLLEARRIYNAALVSGQLSDVDATAAKSELNQISQTVVFSSKVFADDEYGGTYSVQPGEMLQKIAAQHQITWQYLCRVNNLSDPKRLRAGATIKIIKGPFSAQVDKKKFTMELWIGGEPYSAGAMYVTTFPVGLGKDDSTPDGKWEIQPGNKVKDPTYYSPRGEGVIAAGDPKNPLGQYWMGLVGIDGHAVGQTSYGIHGTIDPDSIGKQASMGCIRMKNEDVAQVFELLVEGKSVVIVKD